MLTIDLSGKKAFVAGVGDDKGFGWAIAKALHRAGAQVMIGVWPPMLTIFRHSYSSGKFDASLRYDDGTSMTFAAIYPFDAMFDTPQDVPQDILENKRYKDVEHYTIREVASLISQQHGTLDIVVHSLANGPEVRNQLLDTSRHGYLSAISASSYSFVSMVSHFGPHMSSSGSVINLTYLASEQVIPGYGGGMSSAKAALESDTRLLAYEAGRRYGIRVNSISAGPYGSRAAKAIGFIDTMIAHSEHVTPLQKAISAEDVGYAAAFLCSSLAGSITAEVLHVDGGMHAMGSFPS